MRYRLRTLLIVLAVGPMVLAGAWFAMSAIVGWLRTPDGEPMQELAWCVVVAVTAAFFGLLLAPWSRPRKSRRLIGFTGRVDPTQW